MDPPPFIQRLRSVAAEHPDRVALLTRGGGVVTYRELLQRAETVAAGLDAERLVHLDATRSAVTAMST